MLDVLAMAGVVDAGGHGLSVMFAGALSYLRGESSGAIKLAAPTVAGMEDGTALREFLESATEVNYGYCTGFMIKGDGLDVGEIREKVGSLGESAVVAGDACSVKGHVQPLNPGPVLTYAAELGTLSSISILNMNEQTRERAARAASPASLTGMRPWNNKWQRTRQYPKLVMETMARLPMRRNSVMICRGSWIDCKVSPRMT